MARDTLEPILDDLPTRGFHWSRLAWANYGDSLLGMGQFMEAQKAFGRAGHLGPLGELSRSRRRMIQMLIDGPRTWGARLTELRDRAEKDGPLTHAENYYLMAQIAHLYDDPTLATEYLRILQRQHKRIAEKAKIGSMMIQICRDRLDHLHAHERFGDEAAFQECWRPELDRNLKDTTHMERVARTYERLGLHHNAMLLQIRILAIQTAANNIVPSQIAYLAHLYAETGRAEETYKTTSFIRDLPNSKAMEADLRLLEARSLYRAQRLEDAEQAYLKAAQPSVHVLNHEYDWR